MGHHYKRNDGSIGFKSDRRAYTQLIMDALRRSRDGARSGNCAQAEGGAQAAREDLATGGYYMPEHQRARLNRMITSAEKAAHRVCYMPRRR